MSGLEVLGALASATQLCEYIINGVSKAKATLKEFKDLPPIIQDRTRYLNDLHLIIQSINTNKSLQPNEVSPFLRTIGEHITSLNALLRQNLKYVQERTLKNVAHVWRNRDSDRNEIIQALENLERDKSNLSLFMVNSVGVNLAQLRDMAMAGTGAGAGGNVHTITELNRREEAEKAARQQQQQQGSGQRLGSSRDGQTLAAPAVAAPAAVKKRSWSNINTKGENVNATYGDRNVKKEDRMEGGEESEWKDINTEGTGIRVVYGDDNDPVPSNAAK